jgi:hypothetical protein
MKKDNDDLFSLPAARGARDDAIKRVGENAETIWKRVALECIHEVALRQEFFVSDDVQKVLRCRPVQTHENRALGAMIMKARKLGWIESTGVYVQSAQKQCHANTVTRWKSLLR